MNQPLPLASRSIRMLPPIGRPWESNLVIWASASCPVGRSVKEKLMLKELIRLRRLFHLVGTVE